jgi:hypothetical protein
MRSDSIVRTRTGSGDNSSTTASTLARNVPVPLPEQFCDDTIAQRIEEAAKTRSLAASTNRAQELDRIAASARLKQEEVRLAKLAKEAMEKEAKEVKEQEDRCIAAAREREREAEMAVQLALLKEAEDLAKQARISQLLRERDAKIKQMSSVSGVPVTSTATVSRGVTSVTGMSASAATVTAAPAASDSRRLRASSGSSTGSASATGTGAATGTVVAANGAGGDRTRLLAVSGMYKGVAAKKANIARVTGKAGLEQKAAVMIQRAVRCCSL